MAMLGLIDERGIRESWDFVHFEDGLARVKTLR